MKLFQIEEPDGTPLAADGPGAAVGVDLAAGGVGRVAIAAGGNAEILPDAAGARMIAAPDAITAELLLALRGRAEKQLARPVTHAVIAAVSDDHAAIEAAAEAAGLAILRLMTRNEAAALAKGAAPEEAAALGAALAAEDSGASGGCEVMTKMVFIDRDGTRKEVDAPVGLSLLEIARRNDIDIEGACEGSLACSTCHVIVEPEWYELLKDAKEDEEDMLDLAFGLTQTSRLGCQILMTEELDGLTVTLPTATRNLLNG